MSTMEAHSSEATGIANVDMKLEVMVIPVSDAEPHRRQHHSGQADRRRGHCAERRGPGPRAAAKQGTDRGDDGPL